MTDVNAFIKITVPVLGFCCLMQFDLAFAVTRSSKVAIFVYPVDLARMDYRDCAKDSLEGCLEAHC